MNLFYLAHAGETHATEAEATAHANESNLPIIIATVVAILAVIVATRLLSKWGKTEEPAEKGHNDD